MDPKFTVLFCLLITVSQVAILSAQNPDLLQNNASDTSTLLKRLSVALSKGHNIFQAAQQFFFFNGPQVWGPQINVGIIGNIHGSNCTNPPNNTSEAPSTSAGNTTTEIPQTNSTITSTIAPSTTTESGVNMLPSVCRLSPTSKTYLPVSGFSDGWELARKRCNDKNGQLPILTSSSDKQEVLKLMKQNKFDFVWLGIHSLYGDKQWYTTTGFNLTELGYHFDGIDQGAQEGPSCGKLFIDTNSVRARDCTSTFAQLICEIPVY